MLRAWCPLESSSNNDELAINDLEGVENFRVLARAGAKFPSNGAQVNNLGSRVIGFNQFTVKDILNQTSRAILSSDDEDKDSSEVEVKSDSPITLKEIAMTGCVILFSVHWVRLGFGEFLCSSTPFKDSIVRIHSGLDLSINTQIFVTKLWTRKLLRTEQMMWRRRKKSWCVICKGVKEFVFYFKPRAWVVNFIFRRSVSTSVLVLPY